MFKGNKSVHILIMYLQLRKKITKLGIFLFLLSPETVISRDILDVYLCNYNYFIFLLCQRYSEAINSSSQFQIFCNDSEKKQYWPKKNTCLHNF